MRRCGWPVRLFSIVLLGSTAMWAQVGRASDPAAVTLPAAKLAEYVGQYRSASEPDVVNSISVKSETLSVEGERMATRELKAASEDHFFVPGTPLRVTFTRDGSGKVSGLKTTASGPRSAGGEVNMARFSAEPAKLNHFREYVRSEAMVPMRDGVKLHVVILRPVGSEKSGEPLPFLMERTPYGVDGQSSVSVNASKPELAASGYIFVFGDIRGRYESEGQFVMNRPIVDA